MTELHLETPPAFGSVSIIPMQNGVKKESIMGRISIEFQGLFRNRTAVAKITIPGYVESMLLDSSVIIKEIVSIYSEICNDDVVCYHEIHIEPRRMSVVVTDTDPSDFSVFMNDPSVSCYNDGGFHE